MTRRIILASNSPRRQELFRLLGYPFEIQISPYDEESSAQPGLYAGTLVKRHAYGKAVHVIIENPDAIVVGADTVVVSPDGRIFGKPADAVDAERMLRDLAGKWHTVHTGICVASYSIEANEAASNRILRFRTSLVSTYVRFGRMTKAEIKHYVESGEPMDKAGAYAIQGGAAPFVQEIQGDFFNVVGLPLFTVKKMIEGAMR